MSDTTTIDGRAPQQRLDEAVEEFAALNKRVEPLGIVYNLPPDLDRASRIDALARLLVDKGVVSEDEIVAATVTRTAEIVEEMTAQGTEHQRQHSGLVVPGAGAQPTR